MDLEMGDALLSQALRPMHAKLDKSHLLLTQLQPNFPTSLWLIMVELSLFVSDWKAPIDLLI
jgi:hypothetical protein